MILYHCTTVDPDTVNATPGLIPGENSWKDWIDMLGPATPRENAIWLTASQAFVGKPSKWSYKCVIPSADRKLVSFKKIMRKAGIDLKALLEETTGRMCLLDWHLYFGTVYPTEVSRVQLDIEFEESISAEDRQRWLEVYSGAAA
jgi:hypothetical protein